MSGAREEILGRIATAIAGCAAPPPPPERRQPRPGEADELAARIDEYRATVTRVERATEVEAAVAAILDRQGAERIAVPADLPASWRPPGKTLLVDDPPLAAGELADLDGALTGSALAIARTGTVVLDCGRAQGRRALSLLPDLHLCVVRAETIVLDVEDAIAALAGATAPVTFVSGPSATSDIELDRVEGVHGPRRLEVLLVSGEESS